MQHINPIGKEETNQVTGAVAAPRNDIKPAVAGRMKSVDWIFIKSVAIRVVLRDPPSRQGEARHPDAARLRMMSTVTVSCDGGHRLLLGKKSTQPG